MSHIRIYYIRMSRIGVLALALTVPMSVVREHICSKRTHSYMYASYAGVLALALTVPMSYASYVCLICMPHIYVCLICMPYMYASYAGVLALALTVPMSLACI